jgi:outer membrane protein
MLTSTIRLLSSSSVLRKASLSAAQTSYDSSLDAYKYGVRSLVDVVQSERQLAEARLVAVRSQAQLMQSAVALGYATGAILKGTTTPGVRP